VADSALSANNVANKGIDLAKQAGSSAVKFAMNSAKRDVNTVATALPGETGRYVRDKTRGW
jgi:sialic acid synthase SpsE